MNNDPSLIYGTWVLVILTGIGIAIAAKSTRESLRLTRKSNVITERMLELTHRPVLRLDDVEFLWEIEKNHHVDTSKVINPQRSPEKLPALFRFKLTNTGAEPARNIIASYDVDFVNSSDDVDLVSYKKKLTTNATRASTLKSKPFNLDLPAGRDETYEICDDFEVMPATKCIILLEISYNFLGDSEGYMQYIYEYIHNWRRILFRDHLS